MDGSTRNSPLFASPRSGMEPPWSTLHRCILPGTGEALKRRACPRLRRASAMVTVHIFIDPGVASRPRAFPFAYAPPGRTLAQHPAPHCASRHTHGHAPVQLATESIQQLACLLKLASL
nr:uncharacterized protein LOC127341301 isoform X3 [Lolium perenne]